MKKRCLLFITIASLLFSSCGNSPEKPKTYIITWKNWDGTTLEVDKDVEYGAIPTYDGTTPTRSKTAQYSYSFNGWSPTISEVTGNATYTAQFTSLTNSYTVTWKNWDGEVLETDLNVLYGTTPTYDGTTPTRSKTAQYSYSFDGWSPTISEVTGNATYTAQFTSLTNSYTVTWKNWDGEVLETDLNVPYGTTPTYDGATPIRESTDDNSFKFKGWTPAIVNVTGDVIYTATYNAVDRFYLITFDAGNGYFGNDMNCHSKTIEVTKGQVPDFTESPNCEFSTEFTCTFTKWDKELTSAYEDFTYNALFSEKKYNQFCIEYDFDSNNRTVEYYNGNIDGSTVWSVDWGDGTTSDKKSFSHTYSYACSGKYYIRFYSNYTRIVNFRLPNNNPQIKGLYFYEEVYGFSITGNEGVETLYFNCKVTLGYLTGNVTIPRHDNSRLVHLKTIYIKELTIRPAPTSDTQARESSYYFCNCDELKTVVIDSYTICSELPNNLFSNCQNLENVSIKKFTSTPIKIYKVFQNCPKLNVPSFGVQISLIGANAFYGCTKLTEYDLTSSITKIETGAFLNTNLKDLYYGKTKQDFLNVTIENLALPSGTIHVHCTDGILDMNIN